MTTWPKLLTTWPKSSSLICLASLPAARSQNWRVHPEATLKPPDPPVLQQGGSDDLGDICWVAPTVYLQYPANIPNLPGHSWANAVAMATPIAHKGSTAGAKVQLMTALDMLLTPELVTQAWDYFKNVQTNDILYTPLIGENDQPAIQLNQDKMEKFAPQLKKYYYDSTKYKSYLEQLGVHYPTVR